MLHFQQQIKERTGWSDAIVRFLHSREEAEVYIKAGLVERRNSGRAALVWTILIERHSTVVRNGRRKSLPFWISGKTITTPT